MLGSGADHSFSGFLRLIPTWCGSRDLPIPTVSAFVQAILLLSDGRGGGTVTPLYESGDLGWERRAACPWRMRQSCDLRPELLPKPQDGEVAGQQLCRLQGF